MQSTESSSSAQSITMLLLEVHIRIAASLACAYGVISLFEEEMDSVTEMLTAGLKFSIQDTHDSLQKLEKYIS